jgi:hypothetical protein
MVLRPRRPVIRRPAGPPLAVTGRFDLSDARRAVLEPLLPKPKKPGRPPKWTKRRLAPAPTRSQLLSLLYQAVHRDEMTKKDAGNGLPLSAGRGSRSSETASSRTWHGRPRTGSGGLIRLTPSTSP